MDIALGLSPHQYRDCLILEAELWTILDEILLVRSLDYQTFGWKVDSSVAIYCNNKGGGLWTIHIILRQIPSLIRPWYCFPYFSRGKPSCQIYLLLRVEINAIMSMDLLSFHDNFKLLFRLTNVDFLVLNDVSLLHTFHLFIYVYEVVLPHLFHSYICSIVMFLKC